LAQEAWCQLGLDRLILMPLGEAAHRQVEQDPGREARYELCRLAVAGDDRFEVSRREIDRAGPSYTVLTLRALRQSAPDDELFFVMGGDEAASLGTWREPEEVLRLATIAVAEREDARQERVRAAIDDLRGSDRVTFFSMPDIAVSSSIVRRRLAEQMPIRFLVPDLVADYIERTGLYRAAVPT
jgi:nicotinate-nucleotide adenylyltransferase